MSQVWTKQLGAAGTTDWIILDARRPWMGTGLGVVLSSNGNLTCKVQHTFDQANPRLTAFSLARTTTTATMTRTNHGMSVADAVTVVGAGAPFDGTFPVASVVDQNNLTYTVANSGATTGAAGAMAALCRVFDHETLISLTARADGNYAYPPIATRLNVTSYTAGYVDFIIVQQGA